MSHSGESSSSDGEITVRKTQDVRKKLRVFGANPQHPSSAKTFSDVTPGDVEQKSSLVTPTPSRSPSPSDAEGDEDISSVRAAAVADAVINALARPQRDDDLSEVMDTIADNVQRIGRLETLLTTLAQKMDTLTLAITAQPNAVKSSPSSSSAKLSGSPVKSSSSSSTKSANKKSRGHGRQRQPNKNIPSNLMKPVLTETVKTVESDVHRAQQLGSGDQSARGLFSITSANAPSELVRQAAVAITKHTRVQLESLLVKLGATGKLTDDDARIIRSTLMTIVATYRKLVEPAIQASSSAASSTVTAAVADAVINALARPQRAGDLQQLLADVVTPLSLLPDVPVLHAHASSQAYITQATALAKNLGTRAYRDNFTRSQGRHFTQAVRSLLDGAQVFALSTLPVVLASIQHTLIAHHLEPSIFGQWSAKFYHYCKDNGIRADSIPTLEQVLQGIAVLEHDLEYLPQPSSSKASAAADSAHTKKTRDTTTPSKETAGVLKLPPGASVPKSESSASNASIAVTASANARVGPMLMPEPPMRSTEELINDRAHTTKLAPVADDEEELGNKVTSISVQDLATLSHLPHQIPSPPRTFIATTLPRAPLASDTLVEDNAQSRVSRSDTGLPRVRTIEPKPQRVRARQAKLNPVDDDGSFRVSIADRASGNEFVPRDALRTNGAVWSALPATPGGATRRPAQLILDSGSSLTLVSESYLRQHSLPVRRVSNAAHLTKLANSMRMADGKTPLPYAATTSLVLQIGTEHHHRIVVPQSFVQRLWWMAHGTARQRHPSKEHMRHQLSKYWWPTMDRDIDLLCLKCPVCLADRRFRHPAAYGPPHFSTIRGKRWQFDTMVMKLDKGNPTKEKYAIICIDEATQYLVTFAVEDPSAPTVIRATEQHWLPHHGASAREVKTDPGTEFANQKFSSYLDANGIYHDKSPPESHQSQTLVERCINDLRAAIRKIVQVSDMRWVEALVHATMAHNAALAPWTGLSPYFLYHGSTPNTPLAYRFTPEFEKHVPQDIHRDVVVRNQIRAEALEFYVARRIEKAKKRNEHLLAMGMKFPNKFLVGEWVMIYRKPPNKLVSKYYGPFIVIATRSNGYHLVLQPVYGQGQIVVHSRLCHRVVDPRPAPSPIPQPGDVIDDSEWNPAWFSDSRAFVRLPAALQKAEEKFKREQEKLQRQKERLDKLEHDRHQRELLAQQELDNAVARAMDATAARQTREEQQSLSEIESRVAQQRAEQLKEETRRAEQASTEPASPPVRTVEQEAQEAVEAAHARLGQQNIQRIRSQIGQQQAQRDRARAAVRNTAQVEQRAAQRGFVDRFANVSLQDLVSDSSSDDDDNGSVHDSATHAVDTAVVEARNSPAKQTQPQQHNGSTQYTYGDPRTYPRQQRRRTWWHSRKQRDTQVGSKVEQLTESQHTRGVNTNQYYGAQPLFQNIPVGYPTGPYCIVAPVFTYPYSPVPYLPIPPQWFQYPRYTNVIPGYNY